MRNYSAMLFLIVLSVCSNVMAVEPVTDQQVMLYYSIPLGGNNPQNKEHKFGLRFDQTTHAPREITEFSNLMKKPATFDLQTGHKNAYTLKIHGVDYTEKLAVYRADAEGKVETDVKTGTDTEAPPVAKTGTEAADTEAATGVEAEAGAAEAPAETPAEDKRTIVQKTLDELPFGVIIGGILLIGIVAGVGG